MLNSSGKKQVMNNYPETGFNVRDKNPYAFLALGDKLCQTKMSVPLWMNSAWKLGEKSGEFQNTTKQEGGRKTEHKTEARKKIKTEMKRGHFTN